MPIFTQPAAEAPAAPTKEQISEQLKVRMSAVSKMQYRQLCEMQKTGINAIWHHPSLSPQEAIDAAFGTEAGKVFVAHGELTKLVVTLAVLDSTPEVQITPDILLPTNDWVTNPDGSITVLEAPYVPS